MEQALLNILRNSIEALSTTDTSNRSIEASATIFQEQVIIRIEDNGPGLSELIVDKIFQPFFSTRDKGLGVGLCIAKTLITSNDGDVVVNLDYKQGACFIISFPYHRDI